MNQRYDDKLLKILDSRSKFNVIVHENIIDDISPKS